MFDHPAVQATSSCCASAGRIIVVPGYGRHALDLVGQADWADAHDCGHGADVLAARRPSRVAVWDGEVCGTQEAIDTGR